MGRTCSTYGAGRGAYRVWCGNLREGDNSENPGVYWKIVLKCVFKKWDEGMDWNNLAQDRDTWRAVVNAVMNLRVP